MGRRGMWRCAARWRVLMSPGCLDAIARVVAAGRDDRRSGGAPEGAGAGRSAPQLWERNNVCAPHFEWAKCSVRLPPPSEGSEFPVLSAMI